MHEDNLERQFGGIPVNIATPEQTRFQIRHKLFSLRKAICISDMSGHVLVTAALKSFRLGYHLRVYSEIHKRTEIFTIRPSATCGFRPTYEVLDTPSGNTVGMLKQNSGPVAWMVMDANGREIGTVMEIRPSRYTLTATVNGETAFRLRPRHRFQSRCMELDFPADSDRVLDRRIGIAVALLQTLVELNDGD